MPAAAATPVSADDTRRLECGDRQQPAFVVQHHQAGGRWHDIARLGRVVNIGSVSAHKGQIGQINFATAKAAMHGFSRALAQEVASRGSPSTPSRLAISPAPRSAAFHRMCSTAWPLRCQCAGSANPSKLPACVPGLLLMRLPMSTAPITRSMAGSTWAELPARLRSAPCRDAMRHACHVNASIRAYRACAADVRADDGAHRAAAVAAA